MEKPLCGGVADIAKFFDQVRRDIVYKIAAAAGIPPTILTAYRAYIENLLLYNCLAGGIGRPHKRRCGIPQGCPFSMMMVALIMRPWVLLMRLIGDVQCFILADDVLILSMGKRMIGKFSRGLNQNHNYLHTMGVKVAPSKSYNFASNKRATVWLDRTWWGHTKAKVEDVKDFRYPGARPTSGSSVSSSTIDKEMG